MEQNNEIILFETSDKEVTLSVQLKNDSVWLNREQLAELFGRDVKTIGKHIGNALKEELDSSTIAKFATVQNEGGRRVKRNIEHYNLDMIISIGYRVKSKRGIEFRQWASKILKQYMIDGYAINEKRLHALQKTVDIQTRMLADIMLLEENAQIKDEESIRRKHVDVK
ncbi:Virulence protein RhuM family protein [Lachnospiraceae bacterium C7]|nr:Virulence protein RhuM family protein [Lachnospiraceae bacterium C7]